MVSSSVSNSTAGTWYQWVAVDCNATTDVATNIWGMWASASNSTTASITTNADTVWYVWNDGIAQYSIHTPIPETDEQKQIRLQREEQARIDADEKKRRDADALQRAEDLLVLQLNTRQLEEYKKSKSFEVESQTGKRFRIRYQNSMNVDEYDANGKVIAKHCIVPKGVIVPLPDQLVMQKLMLEHHEAEFMQIANHRTVQ